MTLSFLINGVEFNSNVFRQSLSVREAMQANGSTLNGVIQLSGALELPVGGQNVKLYRDDVLEFAGRISLCERLYPYNEMQYAISCVDYTPDFDAILLTETIDEPTVGDAIRVITGKVGRGFTSNNVVNGPDIADVVEAEAEQPTGLVTRLSESVEHQWYIDYFRDVHFFYISDRPAPVASIDFDTDVVNYSDLAVSEDVSQVKNVIYLSGAQVESAHRDSKTWVADGDTRFFPLNYQPVSLLKTTVLVDGFPIKLELDSVNSQAGDGGSGVAAYLCLDNWGIRFPDNSPPIKDALIDTIYTYAMDALVKVEDPKSIAMMRERENTADAPSNGRHEFKFEVPDLGLVESEAVIVEYGNLLLARYANPLFTISFDSLTQGWARGQTFRAVSARHGLDTDMYISSVSKTIWQSSGGVTKFKYNIEASSSPFPA